MLSAREWSQIHRVLVIKLRHHGDVLLTSPIFSVLKNHYPDIQCDALVYEDTRAMLDNHPAVYRLFTIDRHWKKLGWMGQAQAEWRLFKQLKARRYDLIIHLTEHNRGAWLVKTLKPRYAVAPNTSGRRFFKKQFPLRYPVIGGNRRHTVEIHLDALRHLGLYPTETERALVFRPSAAAHEKIEQILEEADFNVHPFIVVHPASRWAFKCWPIESMQALLNRLQAQGWPIVLTGAPDPAEQKWVAEIESGLSSAVLNCAGELSFDELGALIQRATLFIGVDSAPMHLASAVQTPVVSLFGPSGDIEWAPWQVPHTVLTHPMPCRPCGKDGCGGGKRSECLERITPETVFEAAEALLKTSIEKE